MPVKTVAATSGVGVGGAIAGLICYFAKITDPNVAVLMTTVVSAVLAGLGAYFPKMEGVNQ